MRPTPRIKTAPTISTPTPTLHILLHRQHILARTTHYRPLMSLVNWPDSTCVSFAGVVAGDAGVELFAAKVLDGDNVEGGVIVETLR